MSGRDFPCWSAMLTCCSSRPGGQRDDQLIALVRACVRVACVLALLTPEKFWARGPLGPPRSAHRETARCGGPAIAVGPALPTHLVVLTGLGVGTSLPVMQPEATSPRFGHAQIVLTAQRIWEVVGAELIAKNSGLRVRVGPPVPRGFSPRRPCRLRGQAEQSLLLSRSRKFWAGGRVRPAGCAFIDPSSLIGFI